MVWTLEVVVAVVEKDDGRDDRESGGSRAMANSSLEFLVACYATLYITMSVNRSVGQSVRHTCFSVIF